MYLRIKKYHLFVLGCQMNKADAEKTAAVLESAGLKLAPSEAAADVIVVLSCSVRQSAVDRIFGKARNWQKRRQKGNLKTILTGCVLDLDKKKMAGLFDAILPIKEIGKLRDYLGKQRNDIKKFDYLCGQPRHESDFKAYVPIMTGCNNYCSYCVVPYVRGREISRPAKEVINECEKLIKKGYKEITLIGQNVNSYKSGQYGFPKLLKKIDEIKGDWWLRFATSHPKDLSEELLEVMANGRHITPYLHLPLQSGDKEILQGMNRHYSPENYLKLIRKVRQKIPNIMISTDIIVGFPGETKKQFINTAKLMKKIGFDMAYIAKYSPRAGTAAAKLKDNVGQEEKKRREQIVNEVLKQTALEQNKKLVNKTVRVLVDGWKKSNCFGKSDTFKTVAFAGSQRLMGKFVAVKIVGANSWGLKGKIV